MATTKERLAHLNSLRESNGLKPLNAWKESKAKLEEAITKLEASVEEKPAAAAKKPSKKKTDAASADTFTLGDIARELGKNPKVLRAKFRRHFPNHDGAWEWPNEKRTEIVAVAKGNK